VVEAITDTGSLLHLYEVGRLAVLSIFDQLIMPNLVAEELRAFGLDPVHLNVAGLTNTIVAVKEEAWTPIVGETGQPTIHPADAQVFVLAQSAGFQNPVLTDDLALRQRLESQSATVVGTVGILVRSYKIGHLRRDELENTIDALFNMSSLYMSRAFRAYIRQLLANLP
jgi:predicted nucleic acid-binding protein